MSLKWLKIRSRKALCIAPCIFLLLIVFFAPVIHISARNNWQKDDTANRKSVVKKPVDPVFINFVTDQDGDPIHQSAGSEEGSIDIPIGESWRLDYYLEEGKQYHVFLVGDWICNETEPRTDYDIKTTYPDGTFLWNTESAGLPEQVANDDEHQYFVPPLTGTFTFRSSTTRETAKTGSTPSLC